MLEAVLCDGWGECGKALIAFDTTRFVDVDWRSGPPLVGIAVYPNDCPAPAGPFGRVACPDANGRSGARGFDPRTDLTATSFVVEIRQLSAN